MKIPIPAPVPPHQEIDITGIAASILKVMVKPYNDFLEQMLKDGRMTEAELDRLHAQVLERGERFDDLMEEEMTRRGEGSGAGAASGGGDPGGGGTGGG